MTHEDRYIKFIKILKNNDPVLTDKESITENILRQIHQKPVKNRLAGTLEQYMFGWVYHRGMRWAMATVTLFLIGFFIVQQIVIQHRLNNLEKQLVKTVNTLNGREAEPGVMQRVKMKIALKEQLKEDSITISVQDMEDLLDNYMDLLEDYENLNRGTVPGLRFGKDPMENTEPVKNNKVPEI